jgi:hypothetical protein
MPAQVLPNAAPIRFTWPPLTDRHDHLFKALVFQEHVSEQSAETVLYLAERYSPKDIAYKLAEFHSNVDYTNQRTVELRIASAIRRRAAARGESFEKVKADLNLARTVKQRQMSDEWVAKAAEQTLKAQSQPGPMFSEADWPMVGGRPKRRTTGPVRIVPIIMTFPATTAAEPRRVLRARTEKQVRPY